MNRVARRAGAILLLAAVLLGGVGFFLVEYFVNGGNWAVHPGSPHVYNGGNIGCGLVTDRNGQLLMDLNEGRTYAATLNLRKSTVHWLGDRQGNISAPTLARYSKELAGYDALSGLYSYSGEGKAELTLSAELQQVALEAMGEYKGTIAIYNYQTGEILCAVTTPTYDPDRPPEIGEHTPAELDGLYLNRFTQSVYIPGSIFKIVTTAAALEEIDDIRQQTFECTGKRTYGPDAVTCEKVHGTLDFDSAMAQSCNCAYASIVDQLGAETLEKYVKKYRVIESLQFEGITTAKGNFDASGAAVQAAWSGIGQHKDQINPAAFLNFVGAIANGGKAARPYLVSEIRCGNSVTYRAKTVTEELVMSREIAEELQRMMRNNVLEKYGEDQFHGFKVCAKTGTGQVGGEREANAMFTGFLEDEQYPLAFLVAVEDGGYGRHVCIPILSKLLQAIKEGI